MNQAGNFGLFLEFGLVAKEREFLWKRIEKNSGVIGSLGPVPDDFGDYLRVLFSPVSPRPVPYVILISLVEMLLAGLEKK